MTGIVITAVFAMSMWVAIWLLTRRRQRPELHALPGQLTPAERRRLYKRLGINPEAMARQRPYGGPMMRSRTDQQARRSTRA